MLAAAVVPHPPQLVPALAAGTAPLFAPLLAACDRAVVELLAREPEIVVCLGAADPGSDGGTPEHHRPDSADWGTLAGFGVAVEAPCRHDARPPRLPLSLTIGRWLLDRAGWRGPVLMHEFAADSTAADCSATGRRLAADAGPGAAWLVLGDGSNRRGEDSPGLDDPRAAGFDAAVAQALSRVDLEALLGLDARSAAELGAVGRPGWQTLAGAAGQTGQAGPIRSELSYDAAPFGVAYFVASWRFGS